MEDNSETRPIHQKNDSDTVDKKENTLVKYKKYLFAIFLIILLILWFINDNLLKGDNHLQEDYNMTADIYYLPDIHASAIHHHSMHGLKCQDFEYGCCKIYIYCKSKNTYLDSTIKYLDPYTIVSRDIIGSNCPSLDNIVHQYNQHYKDKDDCSNSKFGCCPPINTGCDHTFREIDVNDESMIEAYFNENINRKHSNKVSKIDKYGSNCDDLFGVIYKYQRNFPSKSDELITVCVIIGLILCFFTSLK